MDVSADHGYSILSGRGAGPGRSLWSRLKHETAYVLHKMALLDASLDQDSAEGDGGTRPARAPTEDERPTAVYGLEVAAQEYLDYRARQRRHAAELVGHDVEVYAEIWRGVGADEAEPLAKLDVLCGAVVQQQGVRQPPFPGTDERSAEYWTLLKVAFEAAGRTDRAREALERIAADAGCKLIVGPFKKEKRAVEKVRLAYDGDFSLVKDCFRVSIIGDTVAGLLAAAEALVAPGCALRVVRVKNRLSQKYDADTLSAGYRDLQFVATIPGDSNLLVEVQLHLRPFFEHKTEAAAAADASGKTGHQRYIAWRERKEREKFKFQRKHSYNADADDGGAAGGGAKVYASPLPLQSPEPGSRLATAAAAPPDGTELAVLGGDQPVVVIAGRAPAGDGPEEGAAFAETSI